MLYIRNLEEDSIADMIYKKQKEMKWPGLEAETAKICQELCIQDCNETVINKKNYKQIVMEACHTNKRPPELDRKITQLPN